MHTQPQVKVIGSNGQLSLGKMWAGKTVLIDQTDEDTWVIKAGRFIPKSEEWLWQEEHLKKLDAALTWANQHQPHDNFESFSQKVQRKRK